MKLFGKALGDYSGLKKALRTLTVAGLIRLGFDACRRFERRRTWFSMTALTLLGVVLFPHPTACWLARAIGAS